MNHITKLTDLTSSYNQIAYTINHGIHSSLKVALALDGSDGATGSLPGLETSSKNSFPVWSRARTVGHSNW